MNILVTGGMGAVGSFVARKLVEMGMRPVLYSRHKEISLIRDIEKEVVIIEGDILDVGKLADMIKGHRIERIIHTAAMLSESESKPPSAIRVNGEGTANVLEAALKGNVDRVVYTSAKGVYGEARGEYAHPAYKPINEDYPAESVMGFYGLTKLFGEKIGFQYEQKHGITFIALRLSSTYGPGKLLKHGPSSATTIQARIVENAMLGKPTRISQGQDQKNDFIYYKDVARGIVLACTVEKIKHRVFNLGSGHASTLGDFAHAIRKIYPDAVVEIGPGLDYLKLGRNAYNIYDISRMKSELGFSPEYDPEKGVMDYVAMMHHLNIDPIYTPSG